MLRAHQTKDQKKQKPCFVWMKTIKFYCCLQNNIINCIFVVPKKKIYYKSFSEIVFLFILFFYPRLILKILLVVFCLWDFRYLLFEDLLLFLKR